MISRGAGNDPSGLKNAKKWPVLRPEDGGGRRTSSRFCWTASITPGKGMEYWFFGVTTTTRSGRSRRRGAPDTGLTCADTWRVLLGEERFAMVVTAALESVGDGEFPLDLSRQDRVFLLGENRFEDRKVEPA